MKQKIFYLIALSLGISIVTYAQDTEPIDQPTEAETVVQELRKAQGFTVFSRLIEACGLEEELSKVRDEAYEQAYLQGQVTDLPRHPSVGQDGTLPEHRYYGFTLFAETDAIWEALLGKQAAAITVTDIKNYLTGKGLYPQGNKDDDYTNQNNIVNLFTTYHILPERLAPDRLVIHYNEYGRNFKEKYCTIPVEELYTTLGQPRLLKIYESAESKGIYLNRFPVLRNGRGQFSAANAPDDELRNDYHESGVFQPAKGQTLTADENQGILVATRDSTEQYVCDNVSAINGVIYPIGTLLANTENVQNQLGSQRLRFDVSSLFPEMMNNEIRSPRDYYPYGARDIRAFPASTDYPYFDNLYIAPGSQFYYLSGFGRGWANYQADEFNIVGAFDFTMQLPPVPVSGEYELRYGIANQSTVRTIAQFYLGSDKENLHASGLAVDMRVGGVEKRMRSTTTNSNLGWEEETTDEAYDRLVDIRLREKGYMRGPRYFLTGYYIDSPSARERHYCIRRIVWKGHLEAGKTYYLRIKNCMDDPQLELHMDYLEWCPSNVYDNPEVPEDIW